MQKLLICLLSALFSFQIHSQGNLAWPESVSSGILDNSEIVTQGNASIAIQFENFTNINVLLPGEVSSQPIPPGSVIGVFYDSNQSESIQEWSCGGFNFWPEDSSSFAIAAFEDDYSTSELDGFTSNSEFTWFLRINNTDDPSDGWTDFIGDNVFMDIGSCGGETNCSQTFQPNGLSNLLIAEFELFSEWSNCMDISACNYNSQAAALVDLEPDNQGCLYPENEFVDCNGLCFDDDGDGICNFEEIIGCTDVEAFNFNVNATDSSTCFYQGCMDPIALNFDSSANVSGPCQYPQYQFDWNVQQGYPLNWAVFAIDSIIGLPEYNSFCEDVTVGAFYGNNTYLSNQEVIVDGQLYTDDDLVEIQSTVISGHYPLFESYISAVLANNPDASFGSAIYSYQEYIDEISGWTNYSDTASTPIIEDLIELENLSVSSNLLDNSQTPNFTGYVGDFIEDVYISSPSSSISPLSSFESYQNNLGSNFKGYGNGSFYNCVGTGQYPSLLAIYEDDSFTEEKDGFNNDEPMLFIVELDGVEYLAEPDFNLITEIDGSQSLQTTEFEQNGMYAASLIIVGEVSFGCTDSSYLEFNPSANILDASCVTPVVEGCTDINGVNYNNQANMEDGSCIYEGCTDDNYLEYWSYNPISFSISPSNYDPTLFNVVDNGSCSTLIVYGCTEITAFNYNEAANVDNDSCEEVVEGCTDDTAFNFNPDANTDYDGALCTPVVYGCLDFIAQNYDSTANTDDDSCYYQPGCTNVDALNYNEFADFDDGSCVAIILGCTVSEMFNYNPQANTDDGSCVPFIFGCTNSTSYNYNSNANTDDGSCVEIIEGCTDFNSFNYNSSANTDDGSCIDVIEGCVDPSACNYDLEANTYNGSCFYAETHYDCDGFCLNDEDGDEVCDEFEIFGCTDDSALNYAVQATEDDGSCIEVILGCSDDTALNYDPLANTNDGSCCYVSGCTDSTAFNYNSSACIDDDSCIGVTFGCTDPSQYNYDESANTDDGSCTPFVYGCTDPTSFNYNPLANTDFGGQLCIPVIEGCTDDSAFNYSFNANTDDGSCIEVVLGCTDSTAFNYDSLANTDDGSCIPFVYGCTDPDATNYNENANIDNDSCFYLIFGCTNPIAFNYNSLANVNDGSCIPVVEGCTDIDSYNYDSLANTDDGSCEEVVFGCTNPYYFNYNPEANTDDGSCIPFIYGCTDPTALNYDPLANNDFGGLLCVLVIEGCTDESAINYDSSANTDDGSCVLIIEGCTDESAINYDSSANTDDGTCYYNPGCTDPTAWNFDPLFDFDDGSCIPFIFGCTDNSADNFNPLANEDFGGLLCVYEILGCTDSTAFNYDPSATEDDGSCYPYIFGCLDENAINFNDYDDDGLSNDLTGDPQIDINTTFGTLFCEYPIPGCTDPYSLNYDPSATVDDGSCNPIVFGCMDDNAANYNPLANVDFGGVFCIYSILGCTDSSAINFDPNADEDDGSCIEVVEGCTDETAFNFNPVANTDDGSCIEVIQGCIDETAFNYNPDANTDDGSCIEIIEGCTDLDAMNFNQNANVDDGSCIQYIYGCTDPSFYNYDSAANTDDGSCIPFEYGCTDNTAFNFDDTANTDDGSCIPVIEGCTYELATNYNPIANVDDGSCLYSGCTNPSAENYDPIFNIDDGSCIIVGCAINAWFICNFDPDVTINDWTLCVFDFTGACAQSIVINTPDTYPTLHISEISDDTMEIYNHLGSEKIGCMDKIASNYSSSVVVDDGTCIYNFGPINGIFENNAQVNLFPQPAKSSLTIETYGFGKCSEIDLNIYDSSASLVYQVVKSQEQNLKLDVSNFRTGTYYVRLSCQGSRINTKLVVE